MIHEDCFAYAERPVPGGKKGMCLALNQLYCTHEKDCKFYKTLEQACKRCTYDDCQGCPGEITREKCVV